MVHFWISPAIARPNAWCATGAGKKTTNWAWGPAGHRKPPQWKSTTFLHSQYDILQCYSRTFWGVGIVSRLDTKHLHFHWRRWVARCLVQLRLAEWPLPKTYREPQQALMMHLMLILHIFAIFGKKFAKCLPTFINFPKFASKEFQVTATPPAARSWIPGFKPSSQRHATNESSNFNQFQWGELLQVSTAPTWHQPQRYQMCWKHRSKHERGGMAVRSMFFLTEWMVKSRVVHYIRRKWLRNGTSDARWCERLLKKAT